MLINRRRYITVLCVLLILYALETGQTIRPSYAQPGPVLHVTDLYRPAADPDDHWDLACVYALAARGDIALSGIIIDYPRSIVKNNPDVIGVHQLNYLTGLRVPIAIGSPHRFRSRDDAQPHAAAADLDGVRLILEVLRSSPQPVIVNILGSGRDVAIAGLKEPDLFRDKCAAIYLNAGLGTRDQKAQAAPEYNVYTDPMAYAAVFDLPCPVYWLPCFEIRGATPQSELPIQTYGSFYRFRQDEIFPALSGSMQSFFAYMYRDKSGDRTPDLLWLKYLKGPAEKTVLEQQGVLDRGMWCTGGFFHAAGKAVTRDGRIVRLDQAGDDAVFSFDPVKVSCDDAGVTTWTPAASAGNRFLFHVRDLQRYQSAMTQAMKTLLKTLP